MDSNGICLILLEASCRLERLLLLACNPEEDHSDLVDASNLALAQAVEQNQSLTYLSLSGIMWTDAVVDALSQSMRSNTCIEIFRLQGSLTSAQQQQIETAVHTHPALQELQLVDLQDSSTLIDLARILRGNRTLSRIKLGGLALFPHQHPEPATSSGIDTSLVSFVTMIMETTGVSSVRFRDFRQSKLEVTIRRDHVSEPTTEHRHLPESGVVPWSVKMYRFKFAC